MTTGMKILREMSREELIAEIKATHDRMFARMDDQEVMQVVMGLRNNEFKRRLMIEAGMLHSRDSEWFGELFE